MDDSLQLTAGAATTNSEATERVEVTTAKTAEPTAPATTKADDAASVAGVTSQSDAKTVAPLPAAAEEPPPRRFARKEDYLYDKAQEAFWDTCDRSLHSAVAVDASIPQEDWPKEVSTSGRTTQEKAIQPSRYIMRVEHGQMVESSTWWPGMPMIIHDQFFDSCGYRPAPGRRIYNRFVPMQDLKGNADGAAPWIEHVKRVWPEPNEHEFFFDYCAHMVQHPEEKCNSAIVLCGEQGIGKDGALIPVKMAVGDWNVRDIEPDDVLSPYKPWLQCVMLVVDEVRPTKDEFRASSMYNAVKPLAASPPTTLPLNDKFEKVRYVVNVMRVVITTNNALDMHIPPNDRRMFVMHSPLKKGWHVDADMPEYFKDYFAWCRGPGCANVQAWLMARDLCGFDPKRPAPTTRGKDAVTESWAVDRDDAVGTALEALGEPEAVFLQELIVCQDPGEARAEMERLARSTRRLAHRMQAAGYLLVGQPAGQARWHFPAAGSRNGYRSAKAFARIGLTKQAALDAVMRRGQQKAEELSDQVSVTSTRR